MWNLRPGAAEMRRPAAHKRIEHSEHFGAPLKRSIGCGTPTTAPGQRTLGKQQRNHPDRRTSCSHGCQSTSGSPSAAASKAQCRHRVTWYPTSDVVTPTDLF